MCYYQYNQTQLLMKPAIFINNLATDFLNLTFSISKQTQINNSYATTYKLSNSY